MRFRRLSKREARQEMAVFVADYMRHAADLEAADSPYTELEARSEYIDRLLRILGWDVSNEDSQPQQLRDVVLERGLSESDVGGRPDYLLRMQGRDRLPVEAKKPSVRLSVAPGPARQARSYGWSLSLPAAVLTNVAQIAVFDATIAPEDGDGPDVAVVPGGRFTVDDYFERFDDLWARLSYESVTSAGYYDLYSYAEPPRGTSPFDRSFLAQFKKWRFALASDIAKQNPPLTAGEVGRRTQRLLNALLFLRVCEDRNIGRYEELLKSARDDKLIEAFKAADRAFNAGLFDVLASTTCSPSVLIGVVREMYWPRSKFAFGVLRPDILAEVYEQYLAERVEVDAQRGVVLAPKPELVHAGGVAATPGWVVSKLVAGGLDPQVPAGQPVSPDFKALDLAMGSGPFLIEVLERLIEAQERAGQVVGLAERAALVKSHIFGVDIDGAAVEVAKLSLLLAVLGDEIVDPARVRNVLPDLSSNLLVGNALIESNFDSLVPTAGVIPERRAAAAPLDLTKIFAGIMDAGGFDLVVGNPPYVRIQVLSRFMADQLAYFQDARSGYVSAESHNFDLYQLFVERAFQFLAGDGYLAYIVPNRFTNLLPATGMRRKLGPRLTRLVHFGEQQVFEGRQTYTALVVAGPASKSPAELEIVRDLPAWRDTGTSSVVHLERKLLTGESWPIADEARTMVFEKMQQAAIAKLGDAGWVKSFVAVQTSKDDIFFIKPDPKRSTDLIVRFKDLDGVEREVERAIVRPAVRDRTLEPYGRDPVPDAYIIFPYDVQPPAPPRRRRGKATVYDEAIMKAVYPKALNYLTAHKSALQRRAIPDPGGAFWAYGRSQALANLDAPKLIVRGLSLAPQYMLDTDRLVAPGGGDGGPYCFVRPAAACPYSINVVQAILSHPAVDAFVASRGRLYRGKYVVHRKKFMDPVPVPNLDTTSQHAIEVAVNEMQGIVVQLRTEQDAVIRTALTGRFEVLRTNVNDLISAAYKLTTSDMAAIVGD
ncbi:Eco57I restriction-modification methylase domain-containing protein [Mycobacterium heidelbergense]|uniref:Eco57I restriction-modification methylase domain-containing protein n=1 Tax=Mycobacterium heidelbergense TaxID=53376 RepID=UPI003CE77219